MTMADWMRTKGYNKKHVQFSLVALQSSLDHVALAPEALFVLVHKLL